MKRVSLLVALFALIATSTFAQGFYVQPGVSFQLPASKDVVGVHVKNIGEDNETSAILYDSYGGGFSTDLELGYFFNKHVAANLGLSYVLGSEATVEDFEYNTQNQRDFSVAKNKRLTLSPAITIDAGLEGKLSPYARVGLLIPVGGKTDGTRTSTSCASLLGSDAACGFAFPDFESFEATSVTKGKFTVGATATLGLRYELSDMVSVFGSVTYNGLRIKRNTYEVTGATVTNSDGTVADVIELAAPTHIEYKSEINAQELEAYQLEAGTSYGSEEFPAWDLSQDANFSTVGISIGARFSFGGDTE